MGSGRDKRKKAKGHVPGKGAEKTERKTAKNEKKAQRRVENAAKVQIGMRSLHMAAMGCLVWLQANLFGYKNLLTPAQALKHKLAISAAVNGSFMLVQDEDDIDALLAQFKLDDQQKTKVTVTADVAPPSARVNGSFTAYCTQVEAVSLISYNSDGNLA